MIDLLIFYVMIAVTIAGSGILYFNRRTGTSDRKDGTKINLFLGLSMLFYATAAILLIVATVSGNPELAVISLFFAIPGILSTLIWAYS